MRFCLIKIVRIKKDQQRYSVQKLSRYLSSVMLQQYLYQFTDCATRWSHLSISFSLTFPYRPSVDGPSDFSRSGSFGKEKG